MEVHAVGDMKQDLRAQNGVHFRSPPQLNDSGYPPGPINSFNFTWSVVSRVLYPQELLWTVRITGTMHPCHGQHTQSCPKDHQHSTHCKAALLALLPVLPSGPTASILSQEHGS